MMRMGYQVTVMRSRGMQKRSRFIARIQVRYGIRKNSVTRNKTRIYNPAILITRIGAIFANQVATAFQIVGLTVDLIRSSLVHGRFDCTREIQRQRSGAGGGRGRGGGGGG
uniref:Uncharacterized protein n=1 Tax=Polytomella parva TaxID=51329 RepID=A0A7S0UUS8_9CHLO